MNQHRAFCMGAIALSLSCALGLSASHAQEPKIYLDIDDVIGEPGETITVPVFIENLPDSVQAFELGMTLSRPDIMVFKPAFDQAGTLTESWDGWINLFGDYSARIGAHAGFPPDPDWKPIPPNTSGVLLNLVLELYCGIPDTMQDRTARIEINAVSCMP